jgi:hypothetical protein
MYPNNCNETSQLTHCHLIIMFTLINTNVIYLLYYLGNLMCFHSILINSNSQTLVYNTNEDTYNLIKYETLYCAVWKQLDTKFHALKFPYVYMPLPLWLN